MILGSMTRSVPDYGGGSLRGAEGDARVRERRPGYEGFGRREFRQRVLLDLSGFRFALTGRRARAADFPVGSLLTLRGTGTFRVVETTRTDRIAEDGAIERKWVLRIEPIE